MSKRKPYNKSTGRTYEYDKKYQSSPEQVKNRVARNAARRKMIAEGKVRVGDSRDVDHVNSNPRDNNASNLRVMHKSKNRGKTRNGKRV